jgi:PAS domain S-box-containing protein
VEKTASTKDSSAMSLSRPRVLTSVLVAGFIALIAVLITARIVANVNIQAVYDNSAAVAHTDAVKAALQQLLATLIDAETGERGFIITGDATYLEPYDRALAAVASDLAQVRTLTADNRDQQTDLDRLASLTQMKLDELAEAIRQRRESGPAAAQAVVATNVGKRTMDQMRAIISQMDGREDALLSTRAAQAAGSLRRTVLFGDATTALAVVAVIALFTGTWRTGKERLRAIETSERLRVTLASIGDAMIAADAKGRVSFMNQVAESLTGWKQEEASGRPLEEVFDIVNERTRGSVENPALRAIREGVIVGLANHTVLIGKNGTETPIDDSGSPIRDPEGNTLGAVLIFRDITERKRAEEAIHEQREWFRVTLSSIDDAVIATDTNGAVTFVNHVAESLTGWTREDAAGQSLEKVFRIVNESTRQQVENPALRAMRDGRVVGLTNHTVLISRDGTEIPIDDAGSPIRNAEGKTIGAVLIFRDVAERRRVEQMQGELFERERLARNAAEGANRAKDEFLAVASHELRNPLNSVLGWVSVLRAGQMPLDRAGHALEVIERNTRLEAQLVESLLDVSRIAAGKLTLDSERVDLVSVLHNAVDSVRPAADAKGINLEISAPSELVLVGDSGRLQQVFSNILVNAVKFTARGGHIQVRLTRAGSHAQIRIIDDGEGIEADFLPHIFERFRQAESAKDRTHGGLGLGLAIVRELVNGHGGTVTADSPGKGRGSTFTITLPIPAVIPAHIKPASPRLPQGEEPSISGLRILVVDDDADARELIGLTLQRRGAVVRLVSSAGEALQWVSEGKFDVMVADIGMPHADGYVLIQTIRALERDSSRTRLPAIALTAYTSVGDRDQALAAGYDLHLAKPVGPEDLMHGVAKFRKARGAL